MIQENDYNLVKLEILYTIRFENKYKIIDS
jgi:hypothetical protein